MAQPKQFDINKVENFLKNSADKAQTLSFWNAAVEHGKTIRGLDENLASNDDNETDSRATVTTSRCHKQARHLIKALQNAIKVKYQPQVPETFSTVNKEIQSRLVELQQQLSSIGRVKILMSA